MTEELNFDDLQLVQIPVTLQGGKYYLREASGEAAAAYRDELMRGATLNEQGQAVRVDNWSKAQLILISHCLVDDRGLLVPIAKVKSLPARVTDRLAEKAREISNLDAAGNVEPEARAKNSPNETQVGSGSPEN